MEILICAIILGVIPAAIAQNKGRSFMCWWLYGAAIFIIALPHSLLIKPIGVKKCPFCSEDIKEDAKVCRHCGREFAAKALNKEE